MLCPDSAETRGRSIGMFIDARFGKVGNGITASRSLDVLRYEKNCSMFSTPESAYGADLFFPGGRRPTFQPPIFPCVPSQADRLTVAARVGAAGEQAGRGID